MGGLRKKLPITFWSMLIATLAICGVPFFSGFASKDKLLANVLGMGFFGHTEHVLLPILGFAAATLTAFYMFRLIFMTFFGHPHDHHHYDEAHEVSWNMWVPLAVLAFFSFSVWYTGSLTGGLLGKADQILGGANEWFFNLVKAPPLAYREAMAAAPGHHDLEHLEHVAHIPAMVLSLIVAGGGILFSYLVYCLHKISADRLERIWPRFVQKAIDNLYYFDWFYIKVLIQKGFMPLSDATAKFDDKVIDRVGVDGWKDITMVGQKASGLFDDVVVDGVMVDGIGGGVPTIFGSSLRSLQNGKVQRYLLVAVVALMLAFVFRGVY